MYKKGNKKTGIVTFRRFCRGGYAVFASLHREVRIGVLAIGMFASVNLPKVQAKQIVTSPDADEDGEETELSEVSVVGSMAPLSALQSARIVSVITSQQIASSAAQSVNDLLKLAVGVDVRQRGGFGIQTDISIDGGTFDQITILLNGVNITSPQTGHLSADFPVNLSDIERIEVLEGAASRVYGASAFGGAINIVTKRVDSSPTLPIREGAITKEKQSHFALEAGVQGGSYATFGGDARLSLHSTPSLTGGVGGGSLSASYLRSDGATVNSDFQRGNAFVRGVWEMKHVNADLQGGYSMKDYGANTFYSAAYPNQYERNRRFIFSCGAETKGRLRIHPEIYFNYLLDNFELIRDETFGENFHRTSVYGARVTADYRWAAGRTALGADIHGDEIYSTALGKPITGELIYQVPNEDIYYTRHDARTNVSFNVEHNLLLERFTASVGVLANYNNRFDSGLSFYPGIDLAYTPAPNWRLFASYNKGFRLPTYTDLYYKSPTLEGNLDLKAEESHSFQLGAKFNCQLSIVHSQFSAKLFYHRGSNLIDWVMYAPTDVFHSANFDLDNMGFQVQSTLNVSPFTLNLSYAFMHQRRRDEVEIYKSNYAMEYLRHKFVATLDHPIFVRPAADGTMGKRLTASWTLRWQDRMGSYLLYENAQSTGQLVSYKPYATLDLKVRWQTSSYELWAEGTNLTNHTYYDLGNIPQPGLVLLAGLRLKL